MRPSLPTTRVTVRPDGPTGLSSSGGDWSSCASSGTAKAKRVTGETMPIPWCGRRRL